jgi:hypothetical protein
MHKAPESPGTPEDTLNQFYETLQDKDQEWLEDQIVQYNLPEVVPFSHQRAKLLIVREYFAGM